MKTNVATGTPSAGQTTTATGRDGEWRESRPGVRHGSGAKIASYISALRRRHRHIRVVVEVGRWEAVGLDHVVGEHRPVNHDYDAELRLYNEVLRRACDVQADDRVLDVGCGTGQTTRDAARLARAGSALGIDASAPAIERARQLTRAEGLHNVTFEHADAQVYDFPQPRFDLAISRFGTMFFVDPVAAFANIRRALRPAGRLVMMVWQAHERNEWDVAIHQSLGAAGGPGAVEGPDPFSLAHPPTVRGILTAAGFAGVAFTDVQQPVYYGPDVATALEWVRGFTGTKEMLKRLDPAAASRALARLRDTIAARMSDDGVWFNSGAWIVTAHHAGRV
jgi:SAM-dependent methyltransferase